MRPLEKILVLDFSTLLPGPMASLLLAEAGAEVVKIERPGRGDEMRSYQPRAGEDSANFVLLNRGKRSIAIDLKAPDAVALLTPLIERADVLIEQFRPGVMARFGLGYDDVRRVNPRLIYCSITGWGQRGPKSQIAAHDLNYMAETGVLSVTSSTDGAPALPPVLVADLAAGTYPAVLNILLALRQRDLNGEGCCLDIAMGDNLFTLMYWGLASGFTAGKWPGAGDALVTGGSPRYQIYKTADNQYLAAAPLEDKFWDRFCEIVGLSAEFRCEYSPAGAAIVAVREIIGRQTSQHWRRAFEGEDVCCSIISDLRTAIDDPHVQSRRLFEHRVRAGICCLPALPVPIAAAFRGQPGELLAPQLGEAQDILAPKS
jgi:alpha-methylacyl-CoA racemase